MERLKSQVLPFANSLVIYDKLNRCFPFKTVINATYKGITYLNCRFPFSGINDPYIPSPIFFTSKRFPKLPDIIEARLIRNIVFLDMPESKFHSVVCIDIYHTGTFREFAYFLYG